MQKQVQGTAGNGSTNTWHQVLADALGLNSELGSETRSTVANVHYLSDLQALYRGICIPAAVGAGGCPGTSHGMPSPQVRKKMCGCCPSHLL